MRGDDAGHDDMGPRRDFRCDLSETFLLVCRRGVVRRSGAPSLRPHTPPPGFFSGVRTLYTRHAARRPRRGETVYPMYGRPHTEAATKAHRCALCLADSRHCSARGARDIHNAIGSVCAVSRVGAYVCPAYLNASTTAAVGNWACMLSSYETLFMEVHLVGALSPGRSHATSTGASETALPWLP